MMNSNGLSFQACPCAKQAMFRQQVSPGCGVVVASFWACLEIGLSSTRKGIIDRQINLDLVQEIYIKQSSLKQNQSSLKRDYIIFKLMIRKCSSSLLSNFNHSSFRSATGRTFLSGPRLAFYQTNHTQNSRLYSDENGNTIHSDSTSSYKVSTLESVLNTEALAEQSSFGRGQRIGGQQKPYFLLGAGVLLTFNIIARLVLGARESAPSHNDYR